MFNDDFFKNIETYFLNSNNHTRREMMYNSIKLLNKIEKLFA